MLTRVSTLLSTAAALHMKAAPPKRIVWVRHGEVNSGLKPGAVYGGADVPLSTNGEAEARAAAAMIAAGVTDNVPVTRVFCSPLARAVYGAERVAEACGLGAPTPLDGLREVGRGDWYGLTPAEITEQYGDDANMAAFVSRPTFRPPGGESLEDVAARVLPARDAVLAALEPGTAAVVVSHLFVTRTVASRRCPATSWRALVLTAPPPPPSPDHQRHRQMPGGAGGAASAGRRDHTHRRHRHPHRQRLVRRIRGAFGGGRRGGRPRALLWAQARRARGKHQRSDRGQLKLSTDAENNRVSTSAKESKPCGNITPGLGSAARAGRRPADTNWRSGIGAMANDCANWSSPASSALEASGKQPASDQMACELPSTEQRPSDPRDIELQCADDAGPSVVVRSESMTYASVGEVLKSKYCVAQVIFNMVGSLAGPTFCFWILFAVIGQGPYLWYGPQVLGPVGGGTFFSSILCMALQPMGMPEAVSKGWFHVVRASDVPAWLLWLIRPRNGMARHLRVAVALIPVYWPPTILLARYAVGPVMATWTQIWFGVVYSIFLAPATTAIGLLGFALEHNYARVEATMSMDPRPVRRLVSRFCGCLRLLC